MFKVAIKTDGFKTKARLEYSCYRESETVQHEVNSLEHNGLINRMIRLNCAAVGYKESHSVLGLMRQYLWWCVCEWGKWEPLIWLILAYDIPIVSPLNISGKIVRLWILCSSDHRLAKEKVTRGNSILDGSRSHFQVALRARGGNLFCCFLCILGVEMAMYFPYDALLGKFNGI